AAAKQINDLLNSYRDQLTKIYARAIEIENQRLDNEERLFQYSLERRQLFGGQVSGAQVRQGLLNRVGALTGGATDPNQIALNIQSARSRIEDLRRRAQDPNLSQEDQVRLADQEARLAATLDKNTRALELLRDRTDGLSQIMEQLNRIQQQREARSEERRVGKEWRYGRTAEIDKRECNKS